MAKTDQPEPESNCMMSRPLKMILDISRGRADTGAVAIPASLTPLIERSFRYTWMLVTHKRDELIREGRGEEMEKLTKAAQELQNQLQ